MKLSEAEIEEIFSGILKDVASLNRKIGVLEATGTCAVDVKVWNNRYFQIGGATQHQVFETGAPTYVGAVTNPIPLRKRPRQY